jgi:hypothetical protein
MRWNNRSLHISLNPVRLSITLEGKPFPEIYNFDLTGRPWNMYLHGRFHQRGLDGKIIAKWTDPPAGRGRLMLQDPEARNLEQQASDVAAVLLRDLQAGLITVDETHSDEILQILASAASYAGSRAQKEIARFHEIYTPVGILPPDQYQAVLLQATEGCSFNTCTFCDFYKGGHFRIKGENSFEQHARAVREFLGDGLSLRRTIFLGDANALVIPTERMLALMDIAGKIFDVDALGGFYAFLDGFSGERKSSDEYQRLHRAGLERIYVGLESGHDPLLRFLNKPGSADNALAAVRKMKAGGVPVGIIILLGAGGRKYAAGHIEDTVSVLNRMNLGLDDQIYFSELVEFEELPYAMNAFQADIHPLDLSDARQQAELIQSKLDFDLRSGTPHISRYDIREFVY